MNIAMIGKGAWGSAVGKALKSNGHDVFFIERKHDRWPQECRPEYIFIAIPCQAIRQRLGSLQVPHVPIISLSKGIEIKSGERVSQIISETLPHSPKACVSGPSFAVEVEQRAPTAVVAASEDEKLARDVQNLLHQKMLRVYRSTDLVGVELGGALKNIYALAAGMCVGLKVGENGMAGLLTRSLAEMVRIGVALGAEVETFYGLSGMGDLMLTSYSGLSRNHQVGEALAMGRKLPDILEHLVGTAEGVPTTEAVYRISQEKGIRAPVLQEVYRVLNEGKDPLAAMNDLMLREPTEE